MTDTLQPTASDPRLERIFKDWVLTFTLTEIPIDEIQDLDGQQVRDHSNIANERFVAEYLEQHKNGAVFPPIVLRASNKSMIDGNTRVAMFRKAKATTVPAYLVDTPTLDISRALGAALNQMGGVRLTPDESARQGLAMIEEGSFPDSQIARIVGRSRTQVTRWRDERDFRVHAARLDLTAKAEMVNDNKKRIIAKIDLDRPFTELVNLVAERKIAERDVKEIAEKVKKAPSEDDAVAVVLDAAAALRPTGPEGTAVVRNPKANRMRMVLPQMLNLAPPEELYDADRAEDDRKAWVQLSNFCQEVLDMYEHHR